MMKRAPFWFSLSISRAMRETLLIGGAIWLSLCVLQFFLSLLHLHGTVVQLDLNYTINPLCLAWFVFRTILPPKVWSRQTVRYITNAMLLAFLLILLFLVLYALTMNNLFISKTAGASVIVIVGVFVGLPFFLYMCCFFFLSGLVLFLRFWRRFIQRSLIWQLTNAHTIIIVSVIALLIIGLEIWGFIYYRDVWLIGDLVPTLFAMAALAIFPLLILVPPLAIFSHFVMQHTIKRIETLVIVTTDIRAGDYTIRVPVVGKDEVAQLQENFNAMADKLEQNIQDLQKQRDQVAFLLKERREFFANVSHELRTPIATLRGYLENNLKDRSENAQTPPPTIWQDLQIMEHEVLQLQERTDELFLLSKAEVGQVAIQSTPCDIQYIVRAIVNSYASLAWNAGKVELVADIPNEVPLVFADEQRLEQALGNLLRNALRHTPPGGVIAVVIEVELYRVALSVEDTGEGIAPEALEHIWERFYQSNKSRGGAGIGLTLVKDWIEAMGGSVAVESTLSEGSRFTLYLPRS